MKQIEKEIVVKVEKEIIPKEFFQDREGLFIYSGFEENIRDKAETVPAGAEYKLSSFELEKGMYDEEIEKELGDKHLFSETDVCAIVAGLIEKQSKGEEGVLLTNGYANLFYTSSRVVVVRWGGGRWSVGGWYREDRWDAGYRVFSPATDA